MSFQDHQDAQVLLQQYDALEERREALAALYEKCEEYPPLYVTADVEQADINEALADLADGMAALLRKVAFS